MTDTKTEVKAAPVHRGAARKVMTQLNGLLNKEGVAIAEEKSFQQTSATGAKQKVVEVRLSGERIQDPYKRFWFKKRLAAAGKELGADVQVDRMQRKGSEVTARIVMP